MTTHATPAPTPAVLVLEDGSAWEGSAYGAVGSTLGEAVFSTGMTGYQETLTDPSYAGQIVIQTAPHIGNTGVNDEDAESRRIWVAGYAVREAARIPSNWRSQRSLDEELTDQGIVGIRGIDTRALTRRLREVGAMRAGIFSGDQADRPRAELLAEVRDSAGMLGRRLAEEVSITEEQIVEPSEWGWEGEPRGTVVAVDLGIKSMTPRRFAERGLRTVIVPADTGFQRIRELGADGVFFSNGPGDPETADEQVQLLREVLRAKIPFFGICFGNQLLGRALGFGTYKLPFGHRGINQPVLDRATGTVEITAQNHGFAVDAPLDGPVTAPQEEFGRVEVSHVCLNDDVVEGLRCLDLPAFSVQYHPEAAAGPHDAAYLFDRFIDSLPAAGSAAATAQKAGK
ncbi:glutamine-hydrolyzing carbamoyl-phosphate synthase small subunit [Rothia sp. BD8]|uniref:glutamine-hydrolyzing carbamoyl-phosphate synthase small subunit n=1 Tax=Rothia TaxID=32207 RepID=UPI000736CFDF|nr:glutamine-hydrolyzing carbamoyl-phosphate synthase small subunit [Rothia kristinae]KTR79786.1 carbamoyl phosphate synthase small subunit [Rothia kristinae]WGH08520.1 glutamine-hydrolyzing carbamoyl-phosphate synthase small subunit [Rothia kristinae]